MVGERVEVNQVNTVVFEMLTEDVEVLAKEELVHDRHSPQAKGVSALIMNDHACQDMFGNTLDDRPNGDQPPSPCLI
jgi:hypothetical protein